MTITADIADTVRRVRAEVCALHAELPRNELVVWTAGNVSARVPGRDLLVIKPSGVSYDELTPESMVVTDLEANLVEGDHAPSSDTAAHAYVYAHLPEAGVSVPGQVSVVGFDDIDAAGFTLPPLTTVRQDLVTLGGLGVDRLLARIGGAEPAEPVRQPPELVVRASTAAV